MEGSPDNTTNTPIPQKPVEQTGEPARIIHTYEDDLALAMNATDATVVQELLHTARERESLEKEKETVRHQKGWYTTAGILLLLLALGAAVYGVYYYRHLTVTVAPVASVGVFQSTAPVITSETDINNAITRLTSEDVLAETKPLLVPILTDTTNLTPLTPDQTLTYLRIELGEPFLASISLARLGVYNTGTTISPFLIFSVPNPEIAAKEFLIAEPKLFELVKPILAIENDSVADEVGTSFESTYMYNLPVRTLTSTNIDTNVKTIVLYYAFATDHTVVVATNPTVLKAVYDTIIRQR